MKSLKTKFEKLFYTSLMIGALYITIKYMLGGFLTLIIGLIIGGVVVYLINPQPTEKKS